MDPSRFILGFVEENNIPLVSAFLIGLLTSISPCPLATNITAIAFISKDIKTTKNTLLNGLFYTLGRGLSYTLLASLIYFGLSAFEISRIFQGWGEKALGPLLIILGLIMLGVIKLPVSKRNETLEKFKTVIASKGYLGALLLGFIFALAFCPYSGVLFFGVLIPLVLKSREALLLPSIYALGTGIPVVVFSILIAFGIKHLSRALKMVTKVEKVSRFLVAATFIVVGVFYLRYLAIFLISNFL